MEMIDRLYLLDKRDCDSSVTFINENVSSKRNRSKNNYFFIYIFKVS